MTHPDYVPTPPPGYVFWSNHAGKLTDREIQLLDADSLDVPVEDILVLRNVVPGNMASVFILEKHELKVAKKKQFLLVMLDMLEFMAKDNATNSQRNKIS